MIAFKGFNPGYVCRGYQFKREGWNEEPEANCAKNGFHAASNPLDVLWHYPDAEQSVYCAVDCEGDLDEDGFDEKVACTRMKIIKDLTLEGLIANGLLYIARHPKRELSRIVKRNTAVSQYGYAVVAGKDPKAQATKIGDVLGFIRIDSNGIPSEVDWIVIDGFHFKPGIWYGFKDLY